ncbi:MAG: PEP-CTERM sorting domain-containing protein [Planctomycetota bacterium]
MTIRNLILSMAAVAMLSSAGVAQAGTIDYTGPNTMPGSSMTGWRGSTVWYAGVSESNDDTASRFGAPASITGNAIDFNPTGFFANAPSAGQNSEITDSQLSFTVVALNGTIIENLSLTESGDTTLTGNPASTLTASSVTTFVFVDITEVDGVAIEPINVPATMTFTPSGGTYSLAQDSDGSFPIFSTAWFGEVLIDIDAALQQEVADNPGFSFVNGATRLDVTLNNTLTAISADGESAFIAKKDFDGLTVTANVPEPASLALCVLAMLGWAARRR